MKILYLEKACFSEFFKLIEGQTVHFRHLFRGHSDDSWDLEPCLYRLNIDMPLSEKNQKEKYHFWEQTAVNLFFNESLPYLPPIERNFIDDRILAQHFGVPTRLLDWSYDPLIALFFAVEKWQENTDAAVFMTLPTGNLIPQQYINIMKNDELYKELDSLRQVMAFKPPIIDRRIAAQKSIFMFCPYGDEDKNFVPLNKRIGTRDSIASIKNVSEKNFVKIHIPADFKCILYEKLLYFGIDKRTLFPGLDGIGADVAARMKVGQYLC